MMRVRVRAATCVLAALSLTAFATAVPANDAKSRAYGKRLSSQCTSCHRIDGIENGVPIIVGWPADDFIWVLKTYRDGGRTDPAMVSAVQGLNESQIRALARYFGSLKPSVRLR
jgi:cytochrome c553